jgi:hypothetical protein
MGLSPLFLRISFIKAGAENDLLSLRTATIPSHTLFFLVAQYCHYSLSHSRLSGATVPPLFPLTLSSFWWLSTATIPSHTLFFLVAQYRHYPLSHSLLSGGSVLPLSPLTLSSFWWLSTAIIPSHTLFFLVAQYCHYSLSHSRLSGLPDSTVQVLQRVRMYLPQAWNCNPTPCRS